MLFDTHAWVELLTRSEKGMRVAALMDNEEPATAVASLAELESWALKNGLDAGHILSKVIDSSLVLPFTSETARLAGKIHYENKKLQPDWGMLDSMIYATALMHGLDLVSGDNHFKGKPGIIFLD